MSTEFTAIINGKSTLIGKRYAGPNNTVLFGFAPLYTESADPTFSNNNIGYAQNMYRLYESILPETAIIQIDSGSPITWGEFKNLIENREMALSDNFYGAIKSQ